MTRKSASQIKAKNMNNSNKFVKQQELPPIEETFENAKQAFLNTLETSIVIAKRVDNLLNVRDYAIKFWKDVDGKVVNLPYIKRLQSLTVETYEKLLEATKEFSLDEFLKDDMKDYYEDLIPATDEIECEEDLCRAGLVFLTVKPFGEKMTALHHTVLDEKKQREYMEGQGL